MLSTLFGRLDGPVCIDLFAGGGGASEGIRRATGFHPVVAVNHDNDAIERVLLVNLGPQARVIQPGERIAQLVIAPVPRVRLVAVGSVDDLEATARGAGGFGSTGSGAVPLSAPAGDSAEGQLGLFAARDERGPMEV